ncbi:MAG TPA: hypothetical protein PKD45_04880 [Flavobacteriales bacterium]|nr:hypothetical protein [Flavobacteriales bacterium]
MLKNWTAARWLRLVLAVVFLAAGTMEHEPMAWIAGGILGLQAVLGICCMGPSCATTTPNKGSAPDVQQVNYEEVH